MYCNCQVQKTNKIEALQKMHLTSWLGERIQDPWTWPMRDPSQQRNNMPEPPTGRAYTIPVTKINRWQEMYIVLCASACNALGMWNIYMFPLAIITFAHLDTRQVITSSRLVDTIPRPMSSVWGHNAQYVGNISSDSLHIIQSHPKLLQTSECTLKMSHTIILYHIYQDIYIYNIYI